jgi:hypothetical protein
MYICIRVYAHVCVCTCTDNTPIAVANSFDCLVDKSHK